MPTVHQIAQAIEKEAPLTLQEHYDNSGLQIGIEKMPVEAVLVCLTVTEDIVAEAKSRGCNLIVSHHPVLFHGLKHIGDSSVTERIAVAAIRNDIAIYSAHTNLDSATGGVSFDMAHALGMTNIRPLMPTGPGESTGLGAVGEMPQPVPALEFLRSLAKKFSVKALRYSADPPKIVIRKVALCGGSGAEFIKNAIDCDADAYVTGDIRYHDFDTFGHDILLADIGHYESEFGARKLLRRIVQDTFPDLPVMTAESESNPIKTLS